MDFLIDLTEDCPKPATVPTLLTPLVPAAATPPLSQSQFPQHLIGQQNPSNPFDEAFEQAADFGDPFERVHILAQQRSPTNRSPSDAHPETATGTLIQLDSSLIEEQKFLKSIQSKVEAGNGHRLHSDSDISTLLQTIKKKAASPSPVSRKTRSSSLDQVVRRNQLLKQTILRSISSPLGTPERQGNQSRDESMDNLLDTSPHWIDSETDESDLESMCIPFLKRCTSPTNPSSSSSASVPSGSTRKSLAIDSLAEHMERHKPQTTPPNMPMVAEEHPDEEKSSILESLKQAIDKCDNINDARAILANFSAAKSSTSPSNPGPPPPQDLPDPSPSEIAKITDSLSIPSATPSIIRQGTFNMEEQNVSPSGRLSPVGASGRGDAAASPAAEMSPRSHMENVCKQLGIMNLNNVNMCMVPNGVLPNAMPSNNSTTTYIMVVNTPTTSATPHVSHQNAATDCEDADSPSNYLKTRKSRSHSMSLPQKPSAVAQAMLSKAELRGRLNDNVSTTPTRMITPSVTRRSSFSSSLATSSGEGGSVRRSIYGNKSPVKPRSPSKFNSTTRRSSVAHPTLLKTSANAQIKLRPSASSETGRPARVGGPLRATVPVKCLATQKRDSLRPPPAIVVSEPQPPLGTPQRRPAATTSIRPRASTSNYGSATPNFKRIPVGGLSPASSSAARRRTVSDANVPVSHLPRPHSQGVPKRLSTMVPPTKSNKENLKPATGATK